LVFQFFNRVCFSFYFRFHFEEPLGSFSSDDTNYVVGGNQPAWTHVWHESLSYRNIPRGAVLHIQLFLRNGKKSVMLGWSNSLIVDHRHRVGQGIKTVKLNQNQKADPRNLMQPIGSTAKLVFEIEVLRTTVYYPAFEKETQPLPHHPVPTFDEKTRLDRIFNQDQLKIPTVSSLEVFFLI
jgi:hypothetical protein